MLAVLLMAGTVFAAGSSVTLGARSNKGQLVYLERTLPSLEANVRYYENRLTNLVPKASFNVAGNGGTSAVFDGAKAYQGQRALLEKALARAQATLRDYQRRIALLRE